MSRLKILLPFPLLLCSLALSQSFEGVMTFRVSGNSTQQFTYATKGDKVRMDVAPSPGAAVAMIVDTRTRTVTMIRDQAKMYFELNIDQMTLPPGMKEKEVSITKTGEKETILGYECEQMLIRQEERNAELWVTKGLGRFVQVNLNPRAQSPMLKKLEEELVNQGYFPLRLITTGAEGTEESRMEVTKIEKKSLNDEMFVVPAGYQKMQMPPPPKQ
ncbi:MAG TPA: DUF4412 domain-containing protein [Bacteroidota bacterium]|nr:DUF4412 domain-containing protein [Bacteroidota bacterium]